MAPRPIIIPAQTGWVIRWPHDLAAHGFSESEIVIAWWFEIDDEGNLAHERPYPVGKQGVENPDPEWIQHADDDDWRLRR